MPKSTMQVMTDEELKELLTGPPPKKKPNLPKWMENEIDEHFKTPYRRKNQENQE